MEEPTPTPTGGETRVTEEPTPTPINEAGVAQPAAQEFAIIENYAATRFFPKTIVVIKEIPVKLYLTRLHQEHINRFTISPFYGSSREILPGEIGVIEFLPDQIGEFKIRNVGHGFEATLVVVETIEDVKRHMVEKGVKMFALIHTADASRVLPQKSLVVKDLPVRFFNIGLTAEAPASILPFYVPEDINVRPGEIISFDFTPDATGEFDIQNERRVITGTLVVEEAR